MCSIAGYRLFANKSSAVTVERLHSLLVDANALMKNRGPDEAAFFFEDTHQVGFGHNRLKIQDLTSAGKQPFLSSDRRYVLVFNGQIYNHLEIRRELSGLGWRFASRCDTETLLVAYQQWGEAAFGKFEGMFALSIYDFVEESLLLVRDRLGIKPLYFYFDEQSIIFSSQLNGLAILYDRPLVVSELSRYHYLHLLAVPAPLTFYTKLFKLPAGFLLKATKQGHIITQKWYEPLTHLNKNETFLGLSSGASKVTPEDKLSYLLKNIVKKYVTATDVPVGIFLSGGVDSSLLAKLASEHAQLTAFHLRFAAEKDVTETIFARRVAQDLQLPFFEIVVDEEQFLMALQEVLAGVDDLVADPVCIPFWILAKFAKAAGLKVILLGEGADELFWGYDLYQKHQRLNHFKNLLPMAGIFGLGENFLTKFFKTYKLEVLSRLAAGKNAFVSGAIGLFSQQLVPLKNACLAARDVFAEQVAMIFRFFDPSPNTFDIFDITTWQMPQVHKKILQGDDFWITYQELLHRLPELLLMRCDKVAMAHGVEARVPFLDHRLVEFAMSLPTQAKCFGGHPKALLKRLAEKELFSKSVWNPKIGFSAPLLRSWHPADLNPTFLKQEALTPLQKWSIFLAAKFL